MRGVISRSGTMQIHGGLALVASMLLGCGSSGSGGFGDGGTTLDAPILLLLDGGNDAPGSVDAPLGTGGDARPTIDAGGPPPVVDSGLPPQPVDGGAFTAIPLTSVQGIAYGVTATVGAQSFQMDIDTGSTTVGVGASGCSSCSSVGVSPLYAPGATAVDTHHSAQAEYEDGSGLTGEVYSDTVGLAHGTPSVSLDLVAIATQQQFFQDNTTQGIFGLGPTQNADPFTDAYVAKVTAAGEGNVLAFELCQDSGTMWVGGYDPSAATAPVQFTTMIPISDNNPYYAINLDGMALGSTSLGSSPAAFQEPVIDTGTSLFYVPTPIFNAIVNAVNASSGFTSLFGTSKLTSSDQYCVSSSSVTSAQLDAALPPLTFSVASATTGAPDFTLSLEASQYFFDDGQGDLCLAPGDGGNEDGSTFGDAFMSAFLIVVDIQSGRIGFAPTGGCLTPQEHRVVRRVTAPPRHPHRPHRQR